VPPEAGPAAVVPEPRRLRPDEAVTQREVVVELGVRVHVSVVFPDGSKHIFKMAPDATVGDLKAQAVGDFFVRNSPGDFVLLTLHRWKVDGEPVSADDSFFLVEISQPLLVHVRRPRQPPEWVSMEAASRVDALREWAAEKMGDECDIRWDDFVFDTNPYLAVLVRSDPPPIFFIEPHTLICEITVAGTLFRARLPWRTTAENIWPLINFHFVLPPDAEIMTPFGLDFVVYMGTDWPSIPISVTSLGSIDLRVHVTDRITGDTDNAPFPFTATVDDLVAWLQHKRRGSYHFFNDRDGDSAIFLDAGELLSSRVLDGNGIFFRYDPPPRPLPPQVVVQGVLPRPVSAPIIRADSRPLPEVIADPPLSVPPELGPLPPELPLENPFLALPEEGIEIPHPPEIESAIAFSLADAAPLLPDDRGPVALVEAGADFDAIEIVADALDLFDDDSAASALSDDFNLGDVSAVVNPPDLFVLDLDDDDDESADPPGAADRLAPPEPVSVPGAPARASDVMPSAIRDPLVSTYATFAVPHEAAIRGIASRSFVRRSINVTLILPPNDQMFTLSLPCDARVGLALDYALRELPDGIVYHVAEGDDRDNPPLDHGTLLWSCENFDPDLFAIDLWIRPNE
jgi:hypothetical protein